ncbi:MAG TPA: HNH endonuclease [Mucilaginibacter sp.]|nr:HNH endonuclease [Mucilaginibacter sp.]
MISQNDKQLADTDHSYTKYDSLSRIIETGQNHKNTVNIGSPDYLSISTINGFYNSGNNNQIINTYYDTVVNSGNGIQRVNQSNVALRKRVSLTTYRATQTDTVTQATYYDYDLDGNVQNLYQQIQGLDIKRLNYFYDLISGKTNFIAYQNGKNDRFYYQYIYDATNRLLQVWHSVLADTSTYWKGGTLDTAKKKLDATYQYYLHGPLARMEVGDVNAKVQGTDYAYTIQGWVKGVNAQYLNPALDMGRDSVTVAKDAFGYSLGYYPNDYKPIGGSTSYPAFSKQYIQNLGDITGQSLYNGNISTSTYAISSISSGAPVGYTYYYDQLNRIKKLRQHSSIVNWSSANINNKYSENFEYDGNGNILSLLRLGDTSINQDSLTYKYNRDSNGNLTNNQLNYLHGTGNATNFGTPQYGNNYRYDPIGNMVYDRQDSITNVGWSVYNKIQSITDSGKTISYIYNTTNERVAKVANGLTTWYVKDLQGNPIVVYDNKRSQINWREQDIYGGNRIGVWQPNMNIALDDAPAIADTLGHMRYQATNYLGNVILTYSDIRIVDPVHGDYKADVTTAQDFFAFGALMLGRSVNSGDTRFGFNGKENDNEVKGIGNQQNYGVRIYDNRVGRFLSTDPFNKSYPYLSPYQFAANKPINSIDVEGAETMEVIHWLAVEGTSKEAAKLAAPYTKSVLHMNENQTLLVFGIYNGVISGFDAIGFSQQYVQYANDAMKQIMSARFDTFMQEDLSFDKFKKMFPEVRMAEDAYNGIRNTIHAAYKGDPYAAGQVFGMCLTINISGLNSGDLATFRGFGGEYAEAADIMEQYVPKQDFNEAPSVDIQKVNGRNPRNYRYAGKTYTFEANTPLGKKYPNGVQFNNQGFPDFSPYAKKTVDIGQLNVNATQDELMANKAAGYNSTPKGYTWHHVENSTKVELVPTDLHEAVAHTGGRATNVPK